MGSKNYNDVLNLLNDLKRNNDNLTEQFQNLNSKIDNLSFSGDKNTDKTNKKIKKVRDPNKPKQPLRPRLAFGNTLKAKLRKTEEFSKDNFDDHKLLRTALEKRVSEEWDNAEKNKKSENGKLRTKLEKEFPTNLEKYKKELEIYKNKTEGECDDTEAEAEAEAEEKPKKTKKTKKKKGKEPVASTSYKKPDDSDDDDDILEVEESDLDSE